MQKILLVFPGTVFCWSAPPTGIGYIASSLEGAGSKVRFIDCQITPSYKKVILSLLPEYPVVGISVNAGNVSSALDIARAIRKASPKTRIIMGGPHATAVYERLIPEYADIVVRGEGEDTVVELTQEEDLSRIKGIAYWDNQLKVNPPRPYIEDLDRLRFPTWHLYELKKYGFRNIEEPFALLLTSRGCPYDCIYCVKFVHGYKVRFRSIENVLSEIDYLVTSLGVREIQIMDDVFTIFPDRVKEFCNKLIARGHKKLRLVLGGGIRADFGDEEMFKLLAKAGCYMIDVVIESASQDILNGIGRDCRIDRITGIIEMIKRNGMKVSVFSMLGFPSDTIETLQETLMLIKKLDIDAVTFTLATPYPGTRFHEIVKEKGNFLFNLFEESVRIGTTPSYEMPSLKAGDIQNIFKKANRDFYLRPRRVWGIIRNRIGRPRKLVTMIREGKNLIFQGKTWD